MLKPRALVDILNQANTGGVRSSLLLNQDGVLLAFSGAVNREFKDARVKSAIASTVWNAYERTGRAAFNESGLNTLLIENDEGVCVVTKVSSLLLCLFADEGVGFGILKAKAEIIAKYLEEPLQKVSAC
ncbi:unnamed protein product [Notodromas monacha]|uniref:Ragulator complex protein LAMTOR2 homolog n=1 Tax=Notodromas monacha TaxID=399045 RepID=A0A7R9BSU6_9CRUS|nr:unnamed protein product [Notodromas monacha]CAG0921095.1 unnamed protein product [Notodromas monacha]